MARYLGRTNRRLVKAMTVYVFKNRGMGSNLLRQSLSNVFAYPMEKCAIWNFSTYYNTKSPDYKLTNKELLSILCPHIFVGDDPIFVRIENEHDFGAQLMKLNGFVGMLHGKLEKKQRIELARIIRRRKERLGKNILKLSIYECIAEQENSSALQENEVNFCDQFIARHVFYSTHSPRINSLPRTGG